MTPTAPTAPTMPLPAPVPAAAPTLAERLAQILSNSVTARTVYGEAVSHDGVTVIPVARAAYGFGGGSGTGPNAQGGYGGGGGVSLTPVGFIELKEGRSRFRPIRRSVVPLVAVSGVLALLLLRSVPMLLKNR
ncbi:spore germination protein GerW family protein [Hymenobacter convexus]|uniref:spore germination protein GerW family protein n=1 Tax=Hymenobacter sp. CA1UV-4 TaxID=3063782 RepID=UPI002712D076|nr:spore germination protein GerW family protein [Hymenobacter sp. CA1UV-4]MDO7852517.1 spore germination protein GerW family protein [Hymenobacter sp. CA1UV-4]